MGIVNDRLTLLKNEYHVPLRKISEDTGISSASLSNYFRYREPDYETLFKLADYFNVSVLWLLGRTDIREAAPNEKPKTDVTNILSGESLEDYQIIKARLNEIEETFLEICKHCETNDIGNTAQHSLYRLLFNINSILTVANEYMSNPQDNSHQNQSFDYNVFLKLYNELGTGQASIEIEADQLSFGLLRLILPYITSDKPSQDFLQKMIDTTRSIQDTKYLALARRSQS